jgi:hypothetical protein
MALNVGEYGVIIRFNQAFDLSNQTALSLKLTKPDGTTSSKTSNLVVGSTDIATTLGTFTANEYVEYTVQDGDIDQAGKWTAQLTYTDATKRLITDSPAVFTVKA